MSGSTFAVLAIALFSVGVTQVTDEQNAPNDEEIAFYGLRVKADDIQVDSDTGIGEAVGDVAVFVPSDSRVNYGVPSRTGGNATMFLSLPDQDVVRVIHADRVRTLGETKTIEALGNVVVTNLGSDTPLMEAPQMAIRILGRP